MKKIIIVWIVLLIATLTYADAAFEITSYTPANNTEITLINHNDGFGGYSFGVGWNQTANCTSYMNDTMGSVIFSVINQPNGINIPNLTHDYHDEVHKHNTTCISNESEYATSFVVYTFWANETYPPYVPPEFAVHYLFFPDVPFANESISGASDYNATNLQFELNLNISSESQSQNNCTFELYRLTPSELLIYNDSNISIIANPNQAITTYPLNGIIPYRHYSRCSSNQSPFYYQEFVEFSISVPEDDFYNVNITSPNNTLYLNQDMINFNITFYPDNSTSSCDGYKNGTLESSFIIPGGMYELPFNTSGLPEGYNSIELYINCTSDTQPFLDDENWDFTLFVENITETNQTAASEFATCNQSPVHVAYVGMMVIIALVCLVLAVSGGIPFLGLVSGIIFVLLSFSFIDCNELMGYALLGLGVVFAVLGFFGGKGK